MDLVNAVAAAEAVKARTMKDKDNRLVFLSQSGTETFDDSLLNFIYVDDIRQLLSPEPGVVVFVFIDEKLEIAKCLTSYPDLFGLEPVVIEGVPGQVDNAIFNEAVFGLERAAYHRVVGDIVEAERRASMMTEQERAESVNAAERARYTRKDGSIKPLIDFDHSSGDEEVVDAEVTGD